MAEQTNFYSTKTSVTNACFLPAHGKPLQDTSKANSGTSSNNKVFCSSDNPYNFDVGSAVQYFEKYGVIKWIGILPGDKKLYAKVEMVIICNM